jgi:hypothetical protein
MFARGQRTFALDVAIQLPRCNLQDPSWLATANQLPRAAKQRGLRVRANRRGLEVRPKASTRAIDGKTAVVLPLSH